MSGQSLAKGVGCALLAVLAGCLGAERPVKPPGSALWLAEESGELAPGTQIRLGELGVREIFLQAAELGWVGEPRLTRRSWPQVPRRTATTLVVEGDWRPGDRRAEQVAERLAVAIKSLRIEAEQAGMLPVGVHLRIAPRDQGEHFAQTLGKLRRALGSQLFLSAEIDRAWLGTPLAASVAAEVDFVVGFLYGQRPGEAEDPKAWDLAAVEANHRRLAELERPYLIGAVVLGTATWRTREGAARGTSTELSLGQLLAARGLELQTGFSLQGIDRQVWEFAAKAPSQVAEWRLAAGDRIRVVRTATAYVEEFRRRLGAWESSHRLGEIYYRLPRPSERLSLSAENLIDVLSPSAAQPALELALDVLERGDRRWKVRLTLRNPSSENTEVAFLESNFVELRATGAILGEVDPGQFQRVEVLFGEEKNTMRAMRQADRVRLYLPLLEGGQEAASGPIELRLSGRSAPELTTRAAFLLPDGRRLELAPQSWEIAP